MKWDAKMYDEKHNFSSDYGKAVFEYLPSDPNQAILDIGCGTGDLTADLLTRGGRVVGVDYSPEMIEFARASHPDIEFAVADASKLTFENEFDVVYSNAAFHWIQDQKGLLASVYRALKPGGVLVVEMGAAGNVAKIKNAYEAASGIKHHEKWFFPSVEQYAEMLEDAGLTIDKLYDFDRAVPLVGGADGLGDWIRQFYADEFEARTDEENERLLAEIAAKLKPELWNEAEQRWEADYRRLRIVAHKEV
ncbi:MAG: methyltransferase domain-containing protein [Lactobacillales bacterium]|nr:methyltransferase domain-containing protein [Lactobacillales bacterium]